LDFKFNYIKANHNHQQYDLYPMVKSTIHEAPCIQHKPSNVFAPMDG